MAHIIPFEICGLHYILTCSDNPRAPGLQFRLRDEAFLGGVKAFSAWSCDDLFSKIESHIEMSLTPKLRQTLRDQIEAAVGSAGWFWDIAAALGKPRVAHKPSGWGSVAVGMR